MAALRDLDYRVIGKQRKHPSAQGGYFHARASGARPTRAPRDRRWATGCARSVRQQGLGVPGTGLEPVRPRGAARFKLAVSAFHHPGMGSLGRTSAYGPPHRRATTSLSGGTPPNSGSTNRGCLILLATEGPSASGRGSPTHPRPLDLPICPTTPMAGIDAISTPPDGGPSPPQGGPGCRGIRPESRTETGARTDTRPPPVEDHGRNARKSPTARQEPPP
jgi:hypothetical protein